MSYMKHANPNSTPSNFRSKLGSYMYGLAIGCMIMGFFYIMKSGAQKNQHKPTTPEGEIHQPEGVAP